MTIITILAALLLPALSKAKGMAQSVSCTNNLHQIALFVSFYAGDYGGMFATMDADAVLNWTMPYRTKSHGYMGGGYLDSAGVQSLFCSTCPVKQVGQETYSYGAIKPYGIPSSRKVPYTYAGDSGDFYFLPLSGFRSPSATAIVGDSVIWWGTYKGPYCRLFKDGVGIAHMGLTSGMLCADGHSLQASPAAFVQREIIADDFTFSTSGTRVKFTAGYESSTGRRLF